MKITIDTKEDSHDEIKKIIRMLSSLVGHEIAANQGNIFENSDSAPSSSQDMFNMFDSSPSQSESEKTDDKKPEKPPEKEFDFGIPNMQEYS